MKYDKLVRDKVPEIIEKKGGESFTHIAGEREYWEKLKEKLNEEVGEFLEDEEIEEIADILEVIDAVCEFKSINKNKIKQIKQEKAEERGKFEDRIILEEVK